MTLSGKSRKRRTWFYRFEPIMIKPPLALDELMSREKKLAGQVLWQGLPKLIALPLTRQTRLHGHWLLQSILELLSFLLSTICISHQIWLRSRNYIVFNSILNMRVGLQMLRKIADLASSSSDNQILQSLATSNPRPNNDRQLDRRVGRGLCVTPILRHFLSEQLRLCT